MMAEREAGQRNGGIYAAVPVVGGWIERREA